MTTNHRYKITVPNDPKPFAWLRWLVLAGVLLWSVVYVMGCNYLTLSTASGHPGDNVLVVGNVSTDSGAIIAGAQANVTIDTPLTINFCFNINTDAFSAAPKLNSQSARIISTNTDAPWTDTVNIFSCQIHIPTNTTRGHYAITITNGALSDPMGRELSFTIANGGVDVL